MQSTKKKVAVLIPNYNGKDLLTDCIEPLLKSEYEDIDQYVYVVDNASTDGSVELIRQEWPEVKLSVLPKNIGYAGGNNAGWEQIQKDIPDIDYLYLLNSDTIADHKFLSPLVSYMESHPTCGAAQSLLLLHPRTNEINSIGNRIHFLGFGYSEKYGADRTTAPTEPRIINYASGAAVLVRASALEQVGLFDTDMFMYLEDLDLGWRLSLAGWYSALIPGSIVYHKFDFNRGMKQYFWFERNRIWILLQNYKLRTLALIFPAWLFMEIGQIGFALVNKRLKDKVKAYAFYLKPKTIKKLIRERRRVQSFRVRSDRSLVHSFTGIIAYQPLESPLLKYVANPIFSLYRLLIQFVIFW